MEFEARLDILKTAGMLSEENYELVKQVIGYFAEQEGMVLTEDNAAFFVTHLCSALGRIDSNSCVEMLSDEIYKDVKSDENYQRANAICKNIIKLAPKIPEAEERFLTMHICSVLRKVK